MTKRNGAASVVDLNQARLQPPGQRGVTYKSDGRRMGAHGNRASAAMKACVIEQFREIQALGRDVTRADKMAAAETFHVSFRQVCRWWHAELTREHDCLTATPDPRVVLPRYLYRFANPNQLQLTEAEVRFIACHATVKQAIEAIRQDPGNRLAAYADSTLYEAYGNVAEPIRRGTRKGAAAGRNSEATYPLTGRDAINETWSIDEYDLKLKASYNGVDVNPKLLVVRERLSGNPLAHVVLPRAATGADTCRVLAAAALGFTCQHPRDPNRHLRVAGAARYLVSDQSTVLMGAEAVAGALRLGIAMAPTGSYSPQSNGDHEVMHQLFAAHFAAGAGSRRGQLDHTGIDERRENHGTVPFSWVVDQVAAVINTIRNTPYTKGERKGHTRLEVHADHLDAGNVYQGPVLTDEDIAAFGRVVTENTYDTSRGVHWKTPHHADPYWLSAELAVAAREGDRITLRQLLDPGVVYAYDKHGRFIGPLFPRQDADVAEVLALHADRNKRGATAKAIGKERAAAARLDASEATDAWAETGAGLAQAAADAAATANDAPNSEADEQPEANPTELAAQVPHGEVKEPSLVDRYTARADSDSTT